MMFCDQSTTIKLIIPNLGVRFCKFMAKQKADALEKCQSPKAYCKFCAKKLIVSVQAFSAASGT
ncbi:hypothetical protein Sta7437_3986 [Stanieria cyanosphaera PCC 7437]|uniref:Uncharacterized protein n=1 Tax=Stanieria cyanosphaera (strain ATCC 29371 / PCC 7437) TaxID=111780 RepID=K9XY56_STAC7|nr:hypothetical protein Sta7437_3986 [Stanieria cyanosphaera PCC 7437]